MCHYVPNNIYINCSKRNPNASRIRSFMVTACVCMHSVHVTEFSSLLLLYSEIFLMHWSVFPDVLIIPATAFAKFGHNTTRNLITVRTIAPRPCLLLVPRLLDKVISKLLHVLKVVFHTHTILYDMLSIVAPIDSHRSILYNIVASFYFQTLGESL
jgi:hypothetical protein